MGLRLSYKAGIGPRRGMGWPMCPHAAELMAVPLSTSPPHPSGQHHISDTFSIADQVPAGVSACTAGWKAAGDDECSQGLCLLASPVPKDIRSH